MKIAVAFLCLSVASFIGTSKGGGELHLNADQMMQYYIQALQGQHGATKCQADCHTKKRTAVENYIRLIRWLAQSCHIDLRIYLLRCGYNKDLMNAIVNKDYNKCLQYGDHTYFLGLCSRFVEVACGHGNVLFLNLLKAHLNKLGLGHLFVYVNGILHDTLIAVKRLVAYNVLGELLGAVVLVLTGVVLSLLTLLNGLISGR